MTWTKNDAHMAATLIEKIVPAMGCHVALTGGLLYGGSCKDLDLILYRIRQVATIDPAAIINAISEKMNWAIIGHYGWLWKLEDRETKLKIDIMFPEVKEGQYYPEEK